mgnify:CR=1 FL=1
MKILVTGGFGFIGAKLVESLCEQGHQVRMLSRKMPATVVDTHGAIEIIQCDLLDATFALEKVVDGCSVVFNCAGELHNEALMESLHVDAARRLVQACKKVAITSGKPIHWVQLSSVGAYGPAPINASSERIVTEETVPAPVGAYETTKAKADELVVAALEEGIFSYSILRPSNVYGVGMPNNSIRQWGRAIQQRLFFYVGSRGAVSTYVHVDDVIDALVLCGFDDRAKGEIFNISNDCAQEDVVNAIAKQLNVAQPKLRVPEWLIRLVYVVFSSVKGFPLSKSRIEALLVRTRYPTDKLNLLLGYQPTRDVKETIGEVFLDAVTSKR